MKGSTFLVETFKRIYRGILMEQEGGCSPQKLEIAKQQFVGLFAPNLEAVKGFEVPEKVEEAGRKRSWDIGTLTPDGIAFKLGFEEAIRQFAVVKELMEAEGETRKVFKMIEAVHQEFKERRKLKRLLEKYEHLRKNISQN